jgi:hypothetical protein
MATPPPGILTVGIRTEEAGQLCWDHIDLAVGVQMSGPDRKRRLVLEDEYRKLIRAGVGTVEACRRQGTGHDGLLLAGPAWRAAADSAALEHD